MNSKITRCAAAGALAALLAANSCLAADYTAAPDGQMAASQMAESMGLTSQWNSWKSEWENGVKNDWTQISLTPGSDASKLNFAWYSEVKASGNTDSETASESAAVAKIVKVTAPKLAKSSKPKLVIGEGRLMRNAKVYVAEQETVEGEVDQEGDTYLSNKVTATGLKANTTYYYSYQKENGSYTKPVAYTTKSMDSFSFIYVGDPQIGSSNPLKGQDTEEFYQVQSDSVCSDSFNWEATLNAAMEKSDGEASFVLSAGDQIQTTKAKSPNKDAAKSEIEYAGYLSPDILKSLPVATTVGNHDADNPNYTYHFNTPNNSELGSNGIVGGDYYFTYGSALFMMLNTQDTNVAEHKQFIEQAVAANPDCKWRIVTLHQDIYGSAEHSNEPEITNLRYQLVPYFEANDVDVVLTGHDHAYSRSKMLLGGTQSMDYTDDEFDAQLEKDMDTKGDTTTTLYTAPGNIQNDTTDPDEQKYLAYLNSIMDADAVEQITAESNTVVNPEGILYMTANSSSGSKFYDLVPRMQTYIESRWQEDVPTYAIVEVTDSTFSITSYRTDNGEKIDESFTISKSAADKSSLKELVGSIKRQVVPFAKLYTNDSWKALQSALKAADQVINDENATAAEIEAATKALNDAKAALVKKADISKASVSKIEPQVYTGKAVKPEVTVTLNGKTLTKGTDYSVTYLNNINTGKASAVITGKGDYLGIKTVVFDIVPA